MDENAGYEDAHREQNNGNAQRVAGPVDGVLMAGGILRDPLLVGAVAQHRKDDTPAGNS